MLRCRRRRHSYRRLSEWISIWPIGFPSDLITFHCGLPLPHQFVRHPTIKHTVKLYLTRMLTKRPLLPNTRHRYPIKHMMGKKKYERRRNVETEWWSVGERGCRMFEQKSADLHIELWRWSKWKSTASAQIDRSSGKISLFFVIFVFSYKFCSVAQMLMRMLNAEPKINSCDEICMRVMDVLWRPGNTWAADSACLSSLRVIPEWIACWCVEQDYRKYVCVCPSGWLLGLSIGTLLDATKYKQRSNWQTSPTVKYENPLIHHSDNKR